MKKRFKDIKFKPDSLARIAQINEILDEYESKGYVLSLRQAYYQLVSRDVIPNTEKSYKTLGGLISDARLAGLMSWDAIEDRGRVPKRAPEFLDLSNLVESAVAAYRLPRWEGQDNYVELWVEKDALSGVLMPIARKHHLTFMANKGYSSQSAMYAAAQRFNANRFTPMGKTRTGRRYAIDTRRPGEKIRDLHLLYLGDHDPSGEDMVRDVGARLQMFGADVNVVKVALTMDQVEEYDPPPNPAKITDSRAEAYIAKFGDSSWEVDALSPETLTELIEEEILGLVDLELMQKVIDREEADKAKLRKAAGGIAPKRKPARDDDEP